MLLFRPGFLPLEFSKGRRASYLDPIRMYLFTSFIFFLVFIPYVHHENPLNVRKGESELRDSSFSELRQSASTPIGKLRKVRPGNQEDALSGTNVKPQTTSEISGVDEGWISRKITEREAAMEKKYKNVTELFAAFRDKLAHNFPQMLFLSLPFTALLLNLLYFRHKEYYYVAHAVFTIHLFIFIFILMLAGIGIGFIIDFTGWSKLNFIYTLLIAVAFLYLYKAMRNFYKQDRKKTVLKFFAFCFLFSGLNIFLILIFALLSLFQI